VVDDEDLVRASSANMLIELGYRVVDAGSGEDAVRMLNEDQSIDLQARIISCQALRVPILPIE
jgi:CheY-like chemotaxis protein